MSSSKIKKKLRAPKFLQAQRRWKDLRSYFMPFETSSYMKYQRVLGFGGFGIVQLWHILKDDGAVERAVALKTVIRPDQQSGVRALRREISWHKLFTGSEHLVQLIDLDKKVMDTLDINNEVGTRDPIMVMEELGRGSLGLLLTRIESMKEINRRMPGQHNGLEYIPSKVLWTIFLCLVRACIGMAYPLRDPEKNKGLKIREKIRDGDTARKLVHSDIDPSNIFVSDPDMIFNDPEHAFAPITKIADYGCMVEWDDAWSDKTKLDSLWGKPAYMAPEQLDRKRALRNDSIGTHTNVYQIGATMQELIRQEFVPLNRRSRQIRRIIGGPPISTYGWRLLDSETWKIMSDFRNVDIELRELVAGCMAHNVSDRPPLDVLEDLITWKFNDITKAEEQAAKGLNPGANAFVPGAEPDDVKYHKTRVPLGQLEPEAIILKFYKHYFYDAWAIADNFEDHWNKPPLSPERIPNPANDSQW
ncbi:kinase-like protein [Xylariaceae sp. AK1471]|nr:kinase-like protein [Xylariaceae sp. AK1471]